MNMFEEAETISGMIGMCHMSQREIAEKLGTSQSYVANKVRLLRFSPAMRLRILESGVTERHARTLLRLPSEELQARVLSRIAEGGMNVAVSEILVERVLNEAAGERPPQEGDDGLRAFEELLDRSILTLRYTGVTVEKSVERSDGRILYTVAVGL